MPPINITDVLSPFGALKNPVLYSSGTFSGAMLTFGQWHSGETAGLVMIVLSAVTFVTGMSFYVFALLRLPANGMQQALLEDGIATVARHQMATRSRQARRSNATPAGNAG